MEKCLFCDEEQEDVARHMKQVHYEDYRVWLQKVEKMVSDADPRDALVEVYTDLRKVQTFYELIPRALRQLKTVSEDLVEAREHLRNAQEYHGRIKEEWRLLSVKMDNAEAKLHGRFKAHYPGVKKDW